MNPYHSQISTILKDAWQDKNLELLRSHLASKLEWYESSIENPLSSPDAVISQWEKDLKEQTDLRIEVELLDWIENRAYYHCEASWKDKSDQDHELDGLFVTKLNTEGRIIYFNQWWTRVEREAK